MTQSVVLRRYADVYSALHEPRLSAVFGAFDAQQHQLFRKAGFEEFSPAKVAAWRNEFDVLARGMLGEIEAPLDLVRGFFDPWSLAVAARVTHASCVERLTKLAGDVFDSAAEPEDAALRDRAHQATAELGRSLTSSPMAVQSFVALTQTLPCFLGSAWLALLRHPEELALLRAEPELTASAIEELLRFAGPSRAVFRRALEPVSIGGTRIENGCRVTLLIEAANRDPARFEHADRLDLRRAAAGHVAFGTGPHGCIGASLIRMAAAVATTAVLDRFPGLTLNGEVVSRGGFALRGVASLPVA